MNVGMPIEAMSFLEMISATEVAPDNYCLSTGILYSRYVADCNAVALFSDNSAGLAHLRPSNDASQNSESLLDEMIAKMPQESGLCAFILGGDRKHFRRNILKLRQSGISILGRYCDGWKAQRPDLEAVKSFKHLIVLPKFMSVILYSYNSGWNIFRG